MPPFPVIVSVIDIQGHNGNPFGLKVGEVDFTFGCYLKVIGQQN